MIDLIWRLDMKDRYEFDGMIEPVIDKGGAYVRVPINLREEYGRGRIKVIAYFDGILYEGSVVNMGVKNEDGTICYIIGVRKDIQKKIGKSIGDRIHVVLYPKV